MDLDIDEILCISLNIDEIEKVPIHKNAFDGMSNLRFLKFTKVRWSGRKSLDGIYPKDSMIFPINLRLIH